MALRVSKAHAQPRGHRILNLHFAVIDFEHVGHNGEPKSGAGRLGVEPSPTLDYIRQFLFGDAGSIILENDLQFIRRFEVATVTRVRAHFRALSRMLPATSSKSI